MVQMRELLQKFIIHVTKSTVNIISRKINKLDILNNIVFTKYMYLLQARRSVTRRYLMRRRFRKTLTFLQINIVLLV